jgi:hypothetical protein
LQDNGASNTDSYTKNYNSENNSRIAVLESALKKQKGGNRRRRTKKLKKLRMYRAYKGGNNKYSAIIVEPREHPSLSFVLNNFLKNLSDDWLIIVMHGSKNGKYIDNIISRDLQKYKNRIAKINNINQ